MEADYLITDDGLTLSHLSARGRRGGKTVFVTHSQAQHIRNVMPTLRAFAARNWTVHATDLRGHGHSAGPRAPLAHMDIGAGWERLVADLSLALRHAFQDVPWDNRVVAAPNIGAPLVLEVLKTWPDLAKHIVFVSPPPNQTRLMRLAMSLVRARALLHPAGDPDPFMLHQLYSFFGARVSDGQALIDVVSSDPKITDALLRDPLAWPTPTTGYFHEMFRGIRQAWDWDASMRIAEGTRFLVLYGGDDPVTANGRFVEPMRAQLRALGAAEVDAHCIADGRSGLFIEEERFGISGIISDWTDGRAQGDQPAATTSLADVTSDVLSQRGHDPSEGPLTLDALVAMCYAAIEDEGSLVEVLYRVAHAASAEGDPTDADLDRLFEALAPHLDRSFNINRQIMQSAAIGAILQNVIDRFAIGMAVIAADGAVSYANRPFCAVLGKAVDAVLHPDDLPALGRAMARLTDDAFWQASRTRSGEAMLVHDGAVLGFHFRPQALKQTALTRTGPAGVLIVREGADHEAEISTKVELLQFAYALTEREAQVTLGLMDGLSPDAIAARLDVSINTTRTHLKRIYEKVGVQGQTDLIARLMKGPFGLIAGA
ncbi:MAG: serine aminopeptidase domain-containing protein [Shimia sp.]